MGPPKAESAGPRVRAPKPRTGLLIPLSNRCRSEQDLNLQFLSCDRRVYRSNRSLTASEMNSREKIGEAPLEPFLRPTCVGCGRSFSQPNLPLGTGINGITALEAKYLHLHCPERLSQETEPASRAEMGPPQAESAGPRIRAPKPNRAGRAGLTRFARGCAPLLRSAVPLRSTNRRPRANQAK